MMSDEFDWWRAAVAGNVGPISDGVPESGYYKTRDVKDGPWLPVAIWIKGDKQVCRVAGEMRDPARVWTFCAKHPVAKEAAKHAFEHGRWPDDPEPIAARPNMPSDPFEALKAEIEDRVAQADAWLKAHPKIASQTDCDLARNMQAQLLKLAKTADENRESEKRPHLAASRAVDAKFKPLTEAAATGSSRLRSAFETFMREEENRLRREAQAKFEAERKAAEEERARIETERAEKYKSDPIAALTEDEPELPVVPTAPAEVRVQAGGGVGRKAGLKSVFVATLTNYDAALKHFAKNEKVRDLIQKLGDAAVRNGDREIPGFTVTEERRAA